LHVVCGGRRVGNEMGMSKQHMSEDQSNGRGRTLNLIRTEESISARKSCSSSMALMRSWLSPSFSFSLFLHPWQYSICVCLQSISISRPLSEDKEDDYVLRLGECS